MLVSESGDRQIHIRLSEDVHRKLRMRCAYLETSVQDFVRRVLEHELSKFAVTIREGAPSYGSQSTGSDGDSDG